MGKKRKNGRLLKTLKHFDHKTSETGKDKSRVGTAPRPKKAFEKGE